MTKEQFKTIVDYYQTARKEVDKLQDVGIDLFEHPIIQSFEMMFEEMIKSTFTEEGADWIFWWLYEKHGIFENNNHQAYDKDNNIIPTDTIDELWDNLLYEYRHIEEN